MLNLDEYVCVLELIDYLFEFDYVGGNLAMAFGDGSVGVWFDRL
jgi:hypothetical protein